MSIIVNYQSVKKNYTIKKISERYFEKEENSYSNSDKKNGKTGQLRIM